MATERSKLIKKIDKEFSRFIRMRACSRYGYGDCFTCGTRHHWKEVDAGHFMSRAKMATRWDVRNVQFQCKRCNGFRSGEQYKFAQELGNEIADELVFLSNQTRKFAIGELRELHEHFKKLANDLSQDLG